MNLLISETASMEGLLERGAPWMDAPLCDLPTATIDEQEMDCFDQPTSEFVRGRYELVLSALRFLFGGAY
jgi:hypothetical protein